LEKNIMPLERACHLQGACADDVAMIGRLGGILMKDVHEGDWKTADADYAKLNRLLEKTATDCHSKKVGDDDQCKTDIKQMHEDFIKLSHSVSTHDAKAVEAELEFLIKTIPSFEKVCELKDQCAKDFWIVEGLAKRALNATEAGKWDVVDEDYKDMTETLQKAHEDCHAHPGPHD